MNDPEKVSNRPCTQASPRCEILNVTDECAASMAYSAGAGVPAGVCADAENTADSTTADSATGKTIHFFIANSGRVGAPQ